MCLAHGRTQNNMREWLSWWSTTLPRSGPRVRVPSRALINKKYSNEYFLFFCPQYSNLHNLCSGSLFYYLFLHNLLSHHINSHEQNSTYSVFMHVCEAWQLLLSLQIYSNNQLQMVLLSCQNPSFHFTTSCKVLRFTFSESRFILCP